MIVQPIVSCRANRSTADQEIQTKNRLPSPVLLLNARDEERTTHAECGYLGGYQDIENVERTASLHKLVNRSQIQSDETHRTDRRTLVAQRFIFRV